MRIQSLIIYPAALLSCCLAGAQTEARFPSQVTTSDGTLYKDTVKVRVDPDGILVNYQPGAGGLGLAKLKFRDLPEDLQKQYGYDPKNAAEFEKQTAQAAEQWRSQMTANDALARYRELAELHRALAGDDSVSYTLSMDNSGKISAQGFTETKPAVPVPEAPAPAPAAVTYPSPLLYLPLGESRNPPTKVIEQPALVPRRRPPPRTP